MDSQLKKVLHLPSGEDELLLLLYRFYLKIYNHDITSFIKEFENQLKPYTSQLFGREYFKVLIMKYYLQFNTLPFFAIESHFPTLVFREILNRYNKEEEIDLEIRNFILVDKGHHFNEAEPRTNEHRGEYALEFYLAWKKNDTERMNTIIKNTLHQEHIYT